MRLVKKIMTVMAAAMMTFGMVGCTSKTNADQIDVSIFQFKVENEAGLQKAADAYMALHPDVSIKINTVGGGADYGAALRTEFSGGNAPTIFNVGGPQDVTDWINSLEDLTDTELSGKAFDGLNEAVTQDGKVYGLPFNQEGYGFIYNKAMFEQAGIDAESITTFSALEEATQKLDSKKDELGIDGVYSLAGKETWTTGLHLSNSFLSAEFGNIVEAMDAKEVEFKYADAMKKLVDLQKDNATAEGAEINTVDYTMQMETQFASGKAAMVHQGNWTYSNIEAIDPELAKNVGFLPVPVEGVVEDNLFVGVPMYWAINKEKTDAEKEAAIDFLTWMYTDPEGQSIVINDLSFIPAYTGFKEKPADPLAQAILEYSENGKTSAWVFMGYPTDWGMGVLGTDMQGYFDGTKTWDEVIESSKESWKKDRA